MSSRFLMFADLPASRPSRTWYHSARYPIFLTTRASARWTDSHRCLKVAIQRKLAKTWKTYRGRRTKIITEIFILIHEKCVKLSVWNSQDSLLTISRNLKILKIITTCTRAEYINYAIKLKTFDNLSIISGQWIHEAFVFKLGTPVVE